MDFSRTVPCDLDATSEHTEGQLITHKTASVCLPQYAMSAEVSMNRTSSLDKDVAAHTRPKLVTTSSVSR